MTTITDADRELTLRSIDEFVDHVNAVLLPNEVGHTKYSLYSDGGRKYVRIVLDMNGQHLAHCFIGCAPGIWGDVYKTSSWRAPALNGARYNLLDPESRDLMYSRFSFAGGYLYK